MQQASKSSIKSDGLVIWITGLSGAGKTTTASHLVELLRHSGVHPVLLDGDQIRNAIGDTLLAHDRESRIVNARRIANLTKYFYEQGFCVIVATMSLFREIHQDNREKIARYFEVYLKTEIETLIKRDPRGMYSKAQRGEIQNVVGIDLEFDEPKKAELVLTVNNQDAETSTLFAKQIVSTLHNKNLLAGLP